MVPMHDKMASRLSMNLVVRIAPASDSAEAFLLLLLVRVRQRERRFMAPMHGKNAVGTFHEPPPLPALPPALGGGEGGRRRGDSNRFMAQMHGTKVVGTLHEPS